MKSINPFRVVIACFALFSMLFMQLAVASYSCPMMMESLQTAQTMQDCEGMDREQPTLCHTHVVGEAAKQSLDTAELPQVQPFVPAGLVMTLPVIDASYFSLAVLPVSIVLIRSTSPPVSILHCCFRI